MIQEYPDYFLNFSCIGGACPDSCCIGWEVDIDEESYYYYQALQGPYGDLIRSRISITPEGDYYFPMTTGKRCPFLNQDNLCDMILHCGEEALCMTCDEYPRYFNRIGSYEQVDISLSCMEAGRLIFSEPGPVVYLKSQLEDYSDPVFAGEKDEDAEWESDAEDDGDSCDEELRQELIYERDRMIAGLQDRSCPVNARIRSVICESESIPADIHPESLQQLPEIFRPQEAIDRSWRTLFKELCSSAEKLVSLEQECYTANRESIELWFEKLAVYFTYRYHLDAYYDDDPAGSHRLTVRSLQMIWLMLLLRWYKNEKAPLRIDDIIDTAHIYSRQTEHCEENIELLKQP